MKLIQPVSRAIVLSIAGMSSLIAPLAASTTTTQLAFSLQPTNTVVAATMNKIAVQITDKNGNAISQSNAIVTLALNKGSGLKGTTNVLTDVFGRASFTNLTILQAGTNDTFIATSAGAKSVTSATFNVLKTGTATITLTASSSSAVYGQSLTFTATVSASAGAPTGTVTFKDGSSVLGSGALNTSGVAIFTTNRLAATNHLIAAIYAGNATFPSATNTVAISVSKLALSASGIIASNKIYDGSTTASLNFNSTTLPVISGDAVTLNTLNAVGTFSSKNAGLNKTVTITGLAIAGTGAANYTLTTPSATIASILPRNLTVTAGSLSRAYGTTNPPLTATITGFATNESLVTSDVTGAPSLTVTAGTNSAVGTYPITITNGTLTSVNYSFSFANGTMTVTQAATALALSTTLNPAYATQNVTFAAGVTATNIPRWPTGTITFKSNGTNLLSSISVTNGSANITLPAGVVGQTNTVVTAEFSDPLGNFKPSTNSISQSILAVLVAGKISIAPSFNGVVTAKVSGGAYQTYVIQVSTDLVHWTSVSTNLADITGNVSLIDSNAVGFPMRFYRVYTP